MLFRSTGDIVAYGGDPQACVDLLRAHGVHVVMGNCEEQIATGAEDCGCGYAPGTACDRLSQAWYPFALRALDAEARDWMGALPRRIDLRINGLDLAFVHGALNAISRFVFASTPARVKARDIEAARVDGIVGGHCGLPFTQIIDGKLWHNAGVIGMPANDGTPRAWCSVLTPGPRTRSLSVEHVALDYDFAAAARSGLLLVWKIVLIVELLGRPNGVGFEIGTAFQLFDVTRILAYAFAFVAAMLAIEYVLVQPLERRVTRWRR